MTIATRTLKFRNEDREVDIAISLFAPERASDGAWFCRYLVDWPEGRREARAGGSDSVQSIVLALQMIGSEIYTSSYHKSGRLYLDDPGRGYGFPVPVSLRDMLVGDDKKFL